MALKTALVVLLAVSLPLWFYGRQLRGEAPLAHNHIDQHSWQARAWLDGHIALRRPPEERLEVAHYRGRSFNSFPPTPSLVELPLVAAFGTRHTPSGAVVYAFLYATLLAQFAALRRCGHSVRSALATPLAFLFGTNVFASCTLATVWGYGQALGFALATTGTCLVIHNPRRGWLGPGSGYVLLALAVGCRPLLLLHAPLVVALDVWTNERPWAEASRRALLCMAPYGSALALYNWARFDDPFEFGHRYLPWAQTLPDGIFSLRYVPSNAHRAFLELPQWSSASPHLQFDPLGGAFWLNNGILVLALWQLWRSRRLPSGVAWVGRLSMGAILLGILMYESSNNVQLGARYFVDLLPGGFAVFALAGEEFEAAALGWSALSVALNLYGLSSWAQLLAARHV